jgi:putative tricarboxylic transport membrane protein
MVENLLLGIHNLVSIENLVFMNIGMLVGIIFGAVPGLSTNLGIMLMLPLTFAMNATTGILMLTGVYCGGTYGGSITAILIGTPGTNVAIATVLDGYPMAKKGQANKALTMALTASTIGGLASSFVLLFTAPIISEIALKFAPPEYFALAVFGLSIIAGISGESLPHGILACLIGYIVSTVGMDQTSGTVRFVFDNVYLLRGLGLIPVLLGAFAVPSLLEKVLNREYETSFKTEIVIEEKDRLENRELKACMPVIIKSTIIGLVIGAIPGAGAAIAAFLAYNEARRTSKTPQNFGKGALEGIAAPESANNAVTGSSFIPLFTLGIPGSVAAAAMIGAFTIHGMQVGPSLFRTQGPLLYAVMVGLIFVNIFMYLQGKFLSKLFAKISKVPQILLIPSLILFCVAGAYSNEGLHFDVYIMFITGIVMYVLQKFGFPGAPFVLGIILGPLAEENLKRSLVMSNGSWLIFLKRPISLVFIIVAIVFTAFSIRKNRQINLDFKKATDDTMKPGADKKEDEKK